MSRQLSARRHSRSSRVNPLVRQLRVDIDADDLPQPSSSTIAAAPASPPARAPAPGDSDWEMDLDDSDEDSDYRQPQDLDSDTDSDTDEELDYVNPHDSSMDSDAPLSIAFDRFMDEKVKENAPGAVGSDFKWEKKNNFVTRFGFSGTPGVKVDHLDGDSTPRELFDCFFTPNLWKTMTDETNRYAAQNPPNPSGPGHMKSWKVVDEEELQQYLGVRLLMGVKRLPSYRDYWSTRPVIGVPFVQAGMHRDRFDAITSHLHFTDNEDEGLAGDRLRKLRPVVDVLAKTFKTVYVPEKEVCVDESLFRYRGRHHAIQFNPSKRARFGLKAYKLCQSCGPAAGYTSAMRMYMGADRGEMPASYQAVTNLMKDAGLYDKGYQMFVDNWYTSPTLFHYLSCRRTNAVGTVRTTRKFMPKDDQVLQVRKKGDKDWRSSGTGQLALAWMDRKQVTMLSTMHKGPETVTLPPNHKGERRVKPLVVVDYNGGMKGVDLSDQMATYYATPRRARKWYHNLFFHLVDTAVVNALLVHRVLGGRKGQKEFRLDLIEDLLQRPDTRTRAERLQGRRLEPVPATPSIPEGHVLVRQAKYRRCKMCKDTKALRKETKFHCSACDVGLCAGECFNSYHH